MLLTEMAYSREFEREAGQYALTYMKSHGIPLKHFADLMRRIESEAGVSMLDEAKKWANYLSTHPLTEERLTTFE